jgi:predicted methyltransferase
MVRAPMRPSSITLPAAVLPVALACASCGGAKPPVLTNVDIPVAPVERPASRAHTQAQAASEPAPPAHQEPATAPPPPASPQQKIVDAEDRTDDDRALDPGRHPAELLAFLGLKTGARVAEIGAGTGYTTELLARDVGAKGKVWAQNPPGLLKFVGKKWDERLTHPAMKNVIRVDRELDSPLPAEARGLDAVVNVLIYHDTVWLEADRTKMNRAVFTALKKGGEYVVIDHSAAEGHGTNDVKTLHRIEESTVVQEVEKAGFKRAGSADFLRNAGDARDWNDAPGASADKRGTSDRFVIRFVKP